jgi:protein TonB
MRKEIFFLGFLLISITGYSQSTDTTNRKSEKIVEPQNSDIQIYCDNEIEAHFPGGVKRWTKFVIKNFRKKILITNKVPSGTYKVLVTFMIANNGKITNIKANTHFGYGIEDEMIRAIEKCPKWKPATNCGRKIDSYQQQPITIIVP